MIFILLFNNYTYAAYESYSAFERDKEEQRLFEGGFHVELRRQDLKETPTADGKKNLCELAKSTYEKGDYFEALTLFQVLLGRVEHGDKIAKSIMIFVEAKSDLELIYTYIAKCYEALGSEPDYEGTEDYFRSAAMMWEEIQKIQRTHEPEMHMNIAAMYDRCQIPPYDKIESHCEIALKGFAEKNSPEDQKNRAHTYMILGNMHNKRGQSGDHQKAFDAFTEAFKHKDKKAAAGLEIALLGINKKHPLTHNEILNYLEPAVQARNGRAIIYKASVLTQIENWMTEKLKETQELLHKIDPEKIEYPCDQYLYWSTLAITQEVSID
nr:uncharacterized protein [uncultured bacterium]